MTSSPLPELCNAHQSISPTATRQLQRKVNAAVRKTLAAAKGVSGARADRVAAVAAAVKRALSRFTDDERARLGRALAELFGGDAVGSSVVR